MRLLILAHGHPDFSAGGAERAAYSIFEHMKAQNDKCTVFFAARAPSNLIGHDAHFGLFRGLPDEILVDTPESDEFTFQSLNYNLLRQILNELLAYTKPDIVHVHHFVYFSIDVFTIIKDFGAKIVFTFHEYLSVCHRYGQMVKTNGRLCYASSPLECSLCFPAYSPGKFLLRSKIIKQALSQCDLMISPSHFLANRLIDWGVPEQNIRVVENPLPPESLRKFSNPSHNSPNVKKNNEVAELFKIRLGYFGRINFFKGLDILMKALTFLPDDLKSQVFVGIHGADLGIEVSSFKQQVADLVAGLDQIVHDFGPYENGSVIELMRQYDWIVVPSVWWENSPVVIQEAKLAGVPVICSGIGGMAEKASDSTDVFFEAGSPMGLAKAVASCIGSPSPILKNQQEFIQKHHDAIFSIESLYRSLR